MGAGQPGSRAESAERFSVGFVQNMVITFAGTSSLFSSIVMTKALARDEFLKMRIYTGAFRDKRRVTSASDKEEFDSLLTERFLVWVPK